MEISKPDYIYHLAAQSFPLTSFEEANSTFNTIQLTDATSDFVAVTDNQANGNFSTISSNTFGNNTPSDIRLAGNVQTALILNYGAGSFNVTQNTIRNIELQGTGTGNAFSASTMTRWSTQ